MRASLSSTPPNTRTIGFFSNYLPRKCGIATLSRWVALGPGQGTPRSGIDAGVSSVSPRWDDPKHCNGHSTSRHGSPDYSVTQIDATCQTSFIRASKGAKWEALHQWD